MADFEEIYRLYFQDVYKYTLSLCRNEALAEELTQQTFFKALKAIDRFDGRCKVSVWLCQIAKNSYYSQLSRRRPEPQPEPVDDGLEQRLADRQTAYALHRILHRLEEPYKEVFSLRTFGELSFRQIAELFGKTESWARVTYHRARLKIKEELE